MPDHVKPHLPHAEPAAPPEMPHLSSIQETAWIEVIRKMEEVYSDLIRHEVDLEEKNKALEEAQRFITSVLSAMSDILVVCDSRGNVVQVNRALLDLTGLAEPDLLGQPLARLFAGGAELPRPCGQGGDGPTECELRLKARDGLTDPVAVNCSTRYDTSGRPAGMVLLGRPVGELRRAYEALKQTQQQLIQSEKMASLGRLVAGVAHELNNPISFVYGNVHALQRYRRKLIAYLDAVHGGVGEDERERLRRELRIDHVLADLEPLIEGTLEGAVRVSDIVKNLRRLSFPNVGEPEAVDLAAVARTAVQWAAKGTRTTARIDLALPEGMVVRGQSGQLNQVIVNLLHNAFDAVAGRPQPVVSVTGAVGEAVRLTVADNGAGIAAEHLLKVFDPFFTTKAVGQGTGLGLWISYGIVRDHGGTITAANAPGGGAVFTIELPRG